MSGMEGDAPVSVFAAFAQSFGFATLLLAAACAFVRMVKGPSVADRAVALDLLAIVMVGFAALYAVVSGEPAFLDVSIALALVAFLGTIAFARFAERRVPEQQARTVADGERG